MDETLRCIMSTGRYLLCFDKEDGVGKGQMHLHYEPTSLLKVKDCEIHKEKWNSEQIRDFVRKLGFMDKQKADGGGQIKRFLSLNQVK